MDDFLAGELMRSVAQPISTPYQLTSEEQAFIIDRQETFQNITSQFPTSVGISVSKEELITMDKAKDISLTYGEIGEMLAAMRSRHGGCEPGKFYDLGSVSPKQGVGKAVVAAALLHPFTESVGIEILPKLYDLSTVVKQLYDGEMASTPNPVPVTYIQGDIFVVKATQEDWRDASVILVNATCFYPEMLERISKAPVKDGCIAISLTRKLAGDHWLQLECCRKTMSWGSSTIYMQRKLSDQALAQMKLDIGVMLNTD